jgi:hypothetical protein
MVCYGSIAVCWNEILVASAVHPAMTDAAGAAIELSDAKCQLDSRLRATTMRNEAEGTYLAEREIGVHLTGARRGRGRNLRVGLIRGVRP